MSANFEIVETFDAYYVRVNGKVDLNLLSQELKRQNLDVDLSKIMREVVNAKAGQEIFLLSKPSEPEGKIVLTVAPGKMSALLTLNIRPGEKVPLDEVFQKLKDKQVVHGVNLERIKTLINLKRPAFRELIAAGDPPEPGLDASIAYTYDQPNLDPIPVADGFTYEPGHIIPVKEGDVIAQRTPFTLGVFGCNVLGEIVHPLPGRNLEFKVGKSVSVKGNTAFAASDGAVIWQDQVIEITDLNTITEDLSQGAITAKGMVLIRGNVGPGVHVQAENDVEICGTLKGGTIVSVSGSVFVRGGIIGQGQAIVKAAGNVEAPFIEDAAIEAGRNLIIDKYIFDSSISVGKAVFFKTVKEFTLSDKEKRKLKATAEKKETAETSASKHTYPERIKQISREIKTLEREMKSFAARFKNLTGREQKLREQLVRYAEQTDSLNQLRQERQSLVDQWGGRGLGILGLLVNVGIAFQTRYEELVLEQRVTHATIFHNYHKNQVAFTGDQLPSDMTQD